MYFSFMSYHVAGLGYEEEEIPVTRQYVKNKYTKGTENIRLDFDQLINLIGFIQFLLPYHSVTHTIFFSSLIQNLFMPLAPRR